MTVFLHRVFSGSELDGRRQILIDLSKKVCPLIGYLASQNTIFLGWLPLAVFFLATAVFRKFPMRPTYLRHRLQSIQTISSHCAISSTCQCYFLVIHPPLPYYLSVHSVILAPKSTLFKPFVLIRYCLVRIAVMVLGVIYWTVWRVVLPKIFGYELVPNKVILDDGTIVNVVRSLFIILLDVWPTIHLFFYNLDESKKKLQYILRSILVMSYDPSDVAHSESSCNPVIQCARL